MDQTLIRSATRTWHWLRSREGIAALAVVLALGAVERFGSRLPPEWSLPPAVGALGMLGVLLRRASRRGLLRWPAWLWTRSQAAVRRGVGRVRRSIIHSGLDLRGAPALRRELPELLVVCGALPWLLASALAMGSGHLEEGWLWLHGQAFLLHTLLLALVWVAALGLTVIFVLLTLGVLHDVCFEPGRRRGQLRAEREYLLQAVVFTGVSVLGFVAAPAHLLEIGCGLWLLALVALGWPTQPAADVAWRPGAGGESRTCSELALVAPVLIALAGLACALALATQDAQWWPADEPAEAATALPFTAGLGRWMLGWNAAAAAGAALLCVVQVLGPRLAFGRADAALPTLRVPSAGDRSQRRELRRGVARAGYDLRFGRAGRRAGDVRVSWDAVARLAAAADAGGLSAAELAPLRRALARRSERLHRRFLRRGILDSYAEADRLRPADSEGCWIGPNLWFERAIAAPAAGDGNGTRWFDPDVGAPFSQRLDWRTRVYWHHFCRRLELDHLFVEAGVPVVALGQVLGILFEIDDVFGGRTRVEERHLRSVPGVRALIHELPGEAPWRGTHYPEPTYEVLARARVLHLFRDRGGLFEFQEPRAPRRSEPLLQGPRGGRGR
jgi:hypothetical protein